MNKQQGILAKTWHEHSKVVVLVTAAAFLSAGALSVPGVRAASLGQIKKQIHQLHVKNQHNNDKLDSLVARAGSYKQAIASLRQQISDMQSSIQASEAQQAKVEHKIGKLQASIKQQKKVLGADLKSMYVNGDVSAIEMLASSKNLSDFVNAQTYRGAVQSKIQDALTRISRLQNKLEDQRKEVQVIIQSKQDKKARLAHDKAKEKQLLSLNKQQQTSYNQKIKANNSKLTKLQAEQARLNAEMFASNGSHIIAGHHGDDTYPSAWRGARKDSMTDSWGMLNRECVSYTAWMVHSDYLAGIDHHDMPYWGGAGNANQWPGNARAAGIPVDHHATPHSIAIKFHGPFGHAMYVRGVAGNGGIYVSQYNEMYQGHFSEAYVSPATIRQYNIVFLHF